MYQEKETRMCTPIQCWDCLDCCGQKEKKDKGKVKEIIKEETISEQKGESSIQARIEVPSKSLEGRLVVENYEEVRNLDCGNNDKLESVELKNLPKLTNFYANGCRIKDIRVENCPNIEDFNASNNLLEDTRFLNGLNPEKLEALSIHSNDFQEQGLGFLSKFINVRSLYIDNCSKEKFEKNIYNHSGLEYLPETVKKIRCSNDLKKDIGCSRIKKELEEIAQLPGVTEKLEGKEKGEE
ncbi:15110_t:CDS:2 [Racocetra persica]|uniref:15110_t:CDS:1 n=1 Tax=Racocetra persica TaxID=160502 RepID=A0ACA9S7N5_9GLOM|nr:15110_t:CDS:2 [Racocetra persica]